MAGRAPHVAVVVPSLTSAGAERVARTLAAEFARTATVTVVTVEPRLGARALRRRVAAPWADQVPDGCRHVHLPSRGSGPFRLLEVALRFAVLAHRRRFDAVYSFLTWTNVVVALAHGLGRAARVHVASEHAMAESLCSDGHRLRGLVPFLPIVYRAPDWIVVVSDAARRSLLDAGLLPRPERAVTVPNPVDAAQVRRLSAAGLPPGVEIPAPGEGHVIACVARLHEQKDHTTLLRALTLLPSSYVLYLVGDGPFREHLEAAVRGLGLAGRVVFVGALPNPYPLMRRADVIVLPSREEGFGLVAVEAAALGVPFVGSDVGGLAEVCAALGHPTFPPGDEEALARVIEEVVAEPGPGRQGGASDTRRFAPPEIARRYLDLAITRPPGSQSG
jgi:glycosyltransferase involved in cell wall biosynthesis